MSGGRVVAAKIATLDDSSMRSRMLDDLYPSARASTSTVIEPSEQEISNLPLHPRHWMKVIDAFSIPRLIYNADKKYFEASKSKPTLFPHPSHKTALFRDRYNIIYQRLLRNESFQMSLHSSDMPSLSRSSSSFAPNQCYKLTPVANLLGRSGTSHLLLGLLSVSPTGDLSLADLTGSIALELSHARMIPEDGAWFAPGMIVLIDGIYEEEETIRGSTLGGNGGIGGAIGGRFIGVSICGPPCERREMSLGTNNQQSTKEINSTGGFGWVDFLGVGSERARGPRMRQIQAKCLQDLQEATDDSCRTKIAIMSEVNLDNVKTLDALKRLLGRYNDMPLGERPMAFVLIGNFVHQALINSGGQAGSIDYKEHFDSLAMVLSEFPSLLQRSTFIFVPGENDPWSSAFSAGAASTIPRHPIPEQFTSRVKRAFATANAEPAQSQSSYPSGEAIWTTNPSRITLFGPVHDIAVFRDDISGRLRRSAVSTRQDPGNTTGMDEATSHEVGYTSPREGLVNKAERTEAEYNPISSTVNVSRKLVKTVLDQGTMSPFPISLRPTLWDYASSLHLYPLPSSLVLADPEAAPFCMTYEGCHVMNPGRLVPEDDLSIVRWIEYDFLKNRGKVRVMR
ncbi:DNA polymerase alpha/epsilon subunit B-domain-containing protein [Aspergillus avenaceus]|uniref:DNA polymerase epsilon subunit B n=1 Tax=Aspergillus avenaceus TaxID=36643 RepID=A0A5N6TIT1_ASPAV|nr:DNA polymerase alpha/epsilon subunit B-domain-containing protein [Aspergillus avenaceus]